MLIVVEVSVINAQLSLNNLARAAQKVIFSAILTHFFFLFRLYTNDLPTYSQIEASIWL
jgi:hypothetical protein